MVTTNTVHPPGVQGRRADLQRPRRCAGSGCARCCAPSTSPPRSAPRPSSCGAAARAASTTGPRTSTPPSTATRRALDTVAGYIKDQGYDLRIALEPKPNEPRGDIFLPTVGHALGSHRRARARRHRRPQPRDRARADGQPQLHPRPRARRCGAASCSTSTSTASAAMKYDQDLVFGHGDLLSAFFTVDLLENGFPGTRRPALHRPAALRLQALAHRGLRRRVGRRPGPAWRPTCCSKERALAFRADPEVQEAMEASGVAELAVPTLAAGESVADFLADDRRSRASTPTRPPSTPSRSCT